MFSLTTEGIFDHVHDLLDRREHTSLLRVLATTHTHSDELVDLSSLILKILRCHSDEVEELIEPILSFRLEQGEQEVFDTCLGLVKTRSHLHRDDDELLESSRYPDIVTSSWILRSKWGTREDICEDNIIDTEAREEIIDIPLRDRSYLDQDIFREDFFLSELFCTILS